MRIWNFWAWNFFKIFFVQNLLWNLKNNCPKGFWIFYGKFFHEPNFSNSPYVQNGSKIRFSVFWKNHTRVVPSGDFFELTQWFYIEKAFIKFIIKACPKKYVWTLAVASSAYLIFWDYGGSYLFHQKSKAISFSKRHV